MKIADLKKLIRIFESSQLSELELDEKGSKVVLKKGGQVPIAYTQQVAQPASEPVPAVAIAETSFHHVGGEDDKPNPKYKIITSPMVGTFYRSPNPASPAFVDEGDKVRSGDVICIIEAMKLMNEIECELDGAIIRIFPENGKPVEFGEPLFEIDPTA